MQKFDGGDALFVVSGKVSKTSDYQTDANVGDGYEYIYIDENVIQRFIVPHPLQLHLNAKDVQDFFITKSGKGHLLTAIRTPSGMKYANQLGQVGKYTGLAKATPGLLVLLALPTCVLAAGGTGGRGGPGMAPVIFTLLVIGVLAYFGMRAFNAPNRAFKLMDKNVNLLKKKFAGQ